MFSHLPILTLDDIVGSVGSSISDLTSHSSRKKFIFTGLLAGGAYYFIKAWWVFVAHGHQHKQVVGSHR